MCIFPQNPNISIGEVLKLEFKSRKSYCNRIWLASSKQITETNFNSVAQAVLKMQQ